MDPQNPQTTSNPNLQKLEEDLQKLSQEAKSETQTQPPVSSVPAKPTVEPTASVAPVTTTPPPQDISGKKSPLSTIAIVLLATAVLAVVAYFVGSVLLGRTETKQSPLPTATVRVIPTPLTTPTASGSINPTTTSSATAKASSSPSATPMPSATGY